MKGQISFDFSFALLSVLLLSLFGMAAINFLHGKVLDFSFSQNAKLLSLECSAVLSAKFSNGIEKFSGKKLSCFSAEDGKAFSVFGGKTKKSTGIFKNLSSVLGSSSLEAENLAHYG